jgi:hypothetical protein
VVAAACGAARHEVVVAREPAVLLDRLDDLGIVERHLVVTQPS